MVPECERVFVVGDVKRQGAFPFLSVDEQGFPRLCRHRLVALAEPAEHGRATHVYINPDQSPSAVASHDRLPDRVLLRILKDLFDRQVNWSSVVTTLAAPGAPKLMSVPSIE
jgi:hypothetical protein